MPRQTQRQPEMPEGQGPGFYQTRLSGRKTGRPSPREHHTIPAREQIEVAHGLRSFASVDPHQGQLFNIKTMPQTSEAGIASRHGVAPPMAVNAPGFMPGLKRKTERSASRAALTGIRKLGEEMGTDTPVKAAIERRVAAYHSGKDVPWYHRRTEVSPPIDPTAGGTRMLSHGGRYQLGEGEAPRLIGAAAQRQQVGYGEMARATAITSPRTHWAEGGAPGTTEHSMPNLASAESVISAVKARHGVEDLTPEQIGEEAYGAALGRNKAKAAEEFVRGEPGRPLPHYPTSLKAPNFEQALQAGHPSQAIRRQAASAYTVDVHDLSAIGLGEREGVRLLKGDTGYVAAAHTGRRAALKVGALPSESQSRVWEATRGEPESMGQHRLFVQRRSGKVVPNPSALPPEHELAGHLAEAKADTRSDFAKRLGLDF
jgi:hypothetical protein